MGWLMVVFAAAAQQCTSLAMLQVTLLA